jgi:hypothetical protein
MKLAIELLKAHRIGIRDFKEHLSTQSLRYPLIITDRGTPISVNLPYSEVLELLDIIDELLDSETLMGVREARKTIKAGVRGIPVARLFNQIRSKRQ